MQIEINLAALHKAQAEPKSSGRPGLVKKKVTVKRGGKTFQQYRWVKSGAEEPSDKKPVIEEPKKVPKKEPVIMGLNKPEPEEKFKEDVPKPEEKPKPEFVGVSGTAKDGSLGAKDRKKASKNMSDFVKKLEKEEKEKDIDRFNSVRGMGSLYTAGNSFSMNAYLLSDRKKGYDYETRGLKDMDSDEKEWYERKVKLLDEFIEKAPKVKCSSYRGMHWDLIDPHEKGLYDQFMSEIKPGNVIESKSYTSTTGNKKILNSYGSTRTGSEVIAKIEYETSSGVYLNGESQSPEQEEVLLPHGLKFEVVEVGKIGKGDNVVIKLREVI